jgi:hypothetical protein
VLDRGHLVVAGDSRWSPKSTEWFSSLLCSQRMKNFDEVAKDLGGFMNLWDMVAKEDIFGEFKRRTCH